MIQLITQSIVELFLKLFDFLSNKRVSKIGDKPTSYALDTDDERLSASPLKSLLHLHSDKSGFHLLENNIDAFVARSMLIDQAKYTLDLQYYSFLGDTSGKLIAKALVKAANRGVRIRVLLDDIDTLGADEAISILNAHPSISIRIFNPFVFRGLLRYLEFIVDLSRVGRRMHNKAMIADNLLAIVGGRNISDVYFSADPEQLFLDIDLLAVGDIVNNVSKSFDEYWNSDWAVPVDILYARPRRIDAIKKIKRMLNKYDQQVDQVDYLNAIQYSKLSQEVRPEHLEFSWSTAELIYDRPGKINFHNLTLEEQQQNSQSTLQQILSQAENELIIISPYFVPGDQGMLWFKQLVDKGVKITVFTNSLAATDVTAVHAGYRLYREALLESGVELFELKATAYVTERKHFKLLKPGSRTSLHAKTYIMDRRKVFIGSPNMDPRSLQLNTEMGLLIDDREMADQFVEMFTGVTDGQNSYRLQLDKSQAHTARILWHSVEDGEEMIHKAEPDTGLFRRFKVFLFSLLPLESLL